MKNLGVILVGGITVPILILVGLYIMWPRQTPPQPAIVISTNEELASVEERLAGREAGVQRQLDTLLQQLEQEQVNFDAGTRQWQTDMTRAQEQLTALQAEAEKLQRESSQLEISRTVQLETYATDLEQLQQQHQARLNQLQTQLQTAQTRLSEITTQLRAR